MENGINLKIRGIQHIGIPVSDINVSIDFYRKLGFAKVMEADFESDGEKGLAVMVEKDGVIIELYQMPEKDLGEIRNRGDGHIDHIAFDVPDIESAFVKLKSAGFTIEDPQPVYLKFWDNGCRYFTIIGPDKERLEFNQIL